MLWRERRRLAYLMFDFDDIDLDYKEEYIDDEHLVETIVNFFETESQLIYPAKSYFVAIVYAKMLERYFDIPFYEALNTEDLLIDDGYFRRYKDNPYIYDEVLKMVPEEFLELPSTEKTRKYFLQEFLIGTDN